MTYTLFDAIRNEGWTPILNRYPYAYPDTVGRPDPTSGVAACENDVLRVRANSWDYAYSAAHEICEVEYGHVHTEMLFCDQANMLSRWLIRLGASKI